MLRRSSTTVNNQTGLRCFDSYSTLARTSSPLMAALVVPRCVRYLLERRPEAVHDLRERALAAAFKRR